MKNKLTAKANGPYFGTFSEAIDACQLPLTEADARLMCDAPTWGGNHWSQDIAEAGPVNYGETLQKHFEILTLKGRSTRKFFHVSIYRTSAGRYELTSYIL